MKKKKRSNVVRYNRWGYIFLIPFFLIFVIFQLIPMVATIWNSFFENYRSGMEMIGPNFVGIENFKKLLSSPDIWEYLKNTCILWIIGFIPQILFALIFAAWFSDKRLHIKGAGFFKSVLYMPNLIMAAAFSMLFFTLFSDSGPINSILVDLHVFKEPVSFFKYIWVTRGMIGFMNFIMWVGNTTLLLLAGMLGIDSSLYEAAEVDGATSTQKFFRITLPILRPILVYVIITSLIGGLQMFDVPSVLTGRTGDPVRSCMTLIMYLNRNMTSKNYGIGGAISVFMFVITGILSFLVFKISNQKEVK